MPAPTIDQIERLIAEHEAAAAATNLPRVAETHRSAAASWRKVLDEQLSMPKSVARNAALVAARKPDQDAG